MTAAEEQHLKRVTVANVLNAMNCTGPLEERAAIIADFLIVVDGRVCVPDENSQPRMIPCPLGSGVDQPFPIDRAIREELLWTKPELRWAPIHDGPGGHGVPSTFLGHGSRPAPTSTTGNAA